MLAEHALHDADFGAQAAAFATATATSLKFAHAPRASAGASKSVDGAGNVHEPRGGESGAGPSARQGGAGGAGTGGWVHLSDRRNPPDYGRIAWPEDILGSMEVDAQGKLLASTWVSSGTYRLVTKEGILGLSDYLMEKVVARLRQEEEEEEEKERQDGD